MSFEEGVADVSYALPEAVSQFIGFFRKHVANQNVYEIQTCYETHWKKLTERYYKDTPWPAAEEIVGLFDGDVVFIALYKELSYRHVYSHLQPSLGQRFESYENYCDLFNYILDSDAPVPLQLPNKWLWDIVDEFIYQFESFCHYRSKLSALSSEDILHLQTHPQIWNVHIVLNVLHSLIEKSNINEQLEVYRQGQDPQEVAGDFGNQPLYKMLGYFSLVGLLRLHSLLGDYHQALSVLQNIELGKKGLYSRVPACQITIYYYVGFAYLMMRRYHDAVRTFASILFYVLRTSKTANRQGGYDTTSKKKEQLFNLLAIAMTLCPQRIDEGVTGQLKEKCGDKMLRMLRNESKAYEEAFQFGCPKFLSPVPPNYDAPKEEQENENLKPYQLQLKLFMEEIEQQRVLTTIRSYLKLYSTMPIKKLASFLNMDEAEFRIQLHNYKHKTNQLIWTSGTALDGERVTSDDVDFFIDGDMIHIAENKIARCYGEFFIHQINKMVSKD